MKIPESFELMGTTIKVEYSEKLLHKDTSVGMAVYRDNLIYLQSPSKAAPIPKSDIEQTFIHEKVHWILNMMGEHDLRTNEKFVDLFAHLLHQSIKSEKGILTT